MAQKVYWITFRVLAQQLVNYGSRWQSRMTGLTSDQIACITSLIAAAQACLRLLPTNTPTE
jgi:hypothetical protein